MNTYKRGGVSLLVVDDDPVQGRAIARYLEGTEFEVTAVTSSEMALDRLAGGDSPAVALIDVVLPGMDGLELLRQIRWRSAFPIVMMTASSTVEMIVGAMRDGAVDFLIKPFVKETLIARLEHVMRQAQQAREVEGLRAELAARSPERKLIGVSPRMLAVARLISEFASSSAPVLITGETGTGKELVARALHLASQRSRGAFVAVNCGAIPEGLFEAELFGYEKGAYTGASDSQAGRIEAADGGTLFLDEVGAMPLQLQSKLLRVLQEREYERVGSRRMRRLECRIITATNVELAKAVEAKQFREDLYYRLRVLEIPLPPLRERLEDIEPIAQYYLRLLEPDGKKPPKVLAPALLQRMRAYHWPGNVRELAGALEQAALLTSGSTIEDVRLGPEKTDRVERLTPFGDAFGKVRDEFEAAYLRQLFKQTRGNLRTAARLSGLSRRHLQRMRAKHGLQLEEFSAAEQSGGDIDVTAAGKRA